MSGDVSSGAPRRRVRLGFVIAACVVLISLVAVAVSNDPSSAPTGTPPLPATAAPGPRAAWLGLDYNSGAGTGRLRDFAARGIVYDREGSIELAAGDTPANDAELGPGLTALYAAGMVPDIVINPSGGPIGCQGNPNPSKRCLPIQIADIAAYVRGFVTTVTSVLRAHRGARALFEPMNEPWDWASPPGTRSGRAAAAEFAAILARLLPAAKAAGIPLGDLYVPATGTLSDGTSWIPDLYGAQPCLKPGASSCGPIAGWNLHPYGLPNSSTEGIASVPVVRAGMLTGKDNVIVSEIGFCATDVGGGRRCNENKSDIVGSSSQTAAWLSQTLREAAAMHRAGWLKALLLWERAGGGGWAMQNPNGSLTAQGRVLDLFADSTAGR